MSSIPSDLDQILAKQAVSALQQPRVLASLQRLQKKAKQQSGNANGNNNHNGVSNKLKSLVVSNSSEDQAVAHGPFAIPLPGDVPSAFTAFVDGTYGDNVTAELEDMNLPFLTISEAISRILLLSGGAEPASPWLIVVRPGVYVENVALPGHISLQGSGALFETQIIGQIVVSGTQGAILQSFLALNFNAPAYFNNTLPGSSTVESLLTAYVSVYTIPNIPEHVTFWSNSGTSSVETSAVILQSFVSPQSFSSPVLGRSSLRFSDSLSVLVQAANAPNASAIRLEQFQQIPDSDFSSSGSQAEISLGSVDIHPAIDYFSVFVINNVPRANINGFRATLIDHSLLSVPHVRTYLTVDNLTSVLSTAGNIVFINVPLQNQALVVGSGFNSRVLLSDLTWAEGPVPKVVGTFGSISYNIASASGSLLLSGGLSANIRSVFNNETPLESDFTLAVQNPNVFISLPDPVAVAAAGQLIKNKIYIIINESSGSTVVTGLFWDNSRRKVIPRCGSLMVQTDGTLWHVLPGTNMAPVC